MKRRCFLVVILLVSLSFLVGCNNKDIKKDTSVKTNKKDYTELFNKDIIQDVYIDIDEENYENILNNALDKEYNKINSFKINDIVIKESGIKTKGFTSLRYLYNTKLTKYSYTINFKKYISKKNGYDHNQDLLGLNKISFNNMYSDATMMKEFLSYYLFNEMGVDSPEYSYVNLYINNKTNGVYLMLEPIDEALIKRLYNEKGKFLFKPEKDGGSLLYNKELDNYLDKDGNYNFDSLLYENGEFKYPRSSNNLLNKYRGIWEDDASDFEDIVDLLPTFFKTLKKIDELNNLKDKNSKYFEEEINKILDIDKLIRYFAVNVYLVNVDSYLSSSPQNYGLYMNNDGFIHIIPWDYNLIFGANFLNNSNDVINYDIYNPTYECELEERPLINLILSNKKYKELYNKYLKDISIILTDGGKTSNGKNYDKDSFKKIMNKYKNIIIDKENDYTDSFYNSEDIKLAQSNLLDILYLRSKAINNQINGNKEIIESDIDINTLGTFMNSRNKR